MRKIILLFLVSSSVVALEDAFLKEASSLAQNLKLSLMKNVSEKVTKEGTEKAIEFCHENVKSIAQSAAKDYVSKYEFGRTSHKLRNKKNQPAPWMTEYLKKFQSTKSGEFGPIVHTLQDGKRVYLDPIYVQPVCLNCHGKDLNASVKEKIGKLYPNDEAVDFSLGDFRGFIWVKEK
jgi:poly-D-alanine transfer protein DltD